MPDRITSPRRSSFPKAPRSPLRGSRPAEDRFEPPVRGSRPAEDRFEPPLRGSRPVEDRFEPPAGAYHCVKLTGLPYTTGVETITDFMGGIAIPDGGIHILCFPNGQATGTAYVEFMTTMDCQTALERDKNYVGKRYINVSPIDKDDMFAEMRVFTEQPPPDRPPLAGDSAVEEPEQNENQPMRVFLRNVPYSCTLSDMMDFFKDFSPLPNSVVFEGQNGKPNGRASIELQNERLAGNAVRELNNKYLKERNILLRLNNAHAPSYGKKYPSPFGENNLTNL
jgi:hypothetical protein